MIRRIRFATALVALITLFAFAAEGVAALVFCAPATGAAQITQTMQADSHTGHGGAVPASDGSDASNENHCPLGMTGSGSCAVAPLPAGLPVVQAAPITSDHASIAPVISFTTGLVHPLFHPPRA